MIAVLLVALTVHTALGLLPDPAPPLLHHGIGTVLLASAALWLGRGRPFVVLSALLLLGLGLSTQTPLGLLQSGTPSPRQLHALGTEEVRREREASDFALLADLQDELRLRNGPLLDLRAASARLHETLATGIVSPLAIEAGLRLSLVDASGVQTLLQRPEYRQLFDPRQTRLALVLPEHAGWTRLLILNQTLKETARKNLTAAILEAMPLRAGAGALEAFVSGCRLLELLPGAVDAADLAARARKLLDASWVPPESLLSTNVGFGDVATTPAQRHRFATLSATRQACGLIRRFGAPPSVDVERLRSALLARLHAGTRFFRPPGSLGLEVGLCLSVLDHARGSAGTTVAARLVHERDLITACCMALLGVCAGRRRARGTERPVVSSSSHVPVP